MVHIRIEDRVRQALRYLGPEDVSSVQRSLSLLAKDPMGSAVQTKRLAGVPNVFVLRASDQLRVVYRIEGNAETPESEPNVGQAPSAIIVEDVISRSTLDRARRRTKG